LVAWGFGDAGFQTIARVGEKASFNYSNPPRRNENWGKYCGTECIAKVFGYGYDPSLTSSLRSAQQSAENKASREYRGRESVATR
jgi:hypothetical protein